MKLQSHLVLVRVDEAKKQDESGIYIAEEWKTLPPTGVVQDTGMTVTFCKKGDKVVFSRYAVINFPGDERLRLCREDDILAVL